MVANSLHYLLACSPDDACHATHPFPHTHPSALGLMVPFRRINPREALTFIFIVIGLDRTPSADGDDEGHQLW